MKTAKFFIFGMLIGSVVHVECYRTKRNLNQYCILDENVRAIGWACMEKFMPTDQKEMYQTITSCLDKTSFHQVLNMFCGRTAQERVDFILENLHCFERIDLQSFARGPTVNLVETRKCVEERISNNEE